LKNLIEKLGRCRRCQALAIDGQTACSDCAKNKRAEMKSLNKERKENGLCTSCGGIINSYFITCKKCRDKSLQWRRSRIAKGLCYTCVKNTPVYCKRQCSSCIESRISKELTPSGRYRKAVTQAKVRAKSRNILFENEIILFFTNNPPMYCLCC